MTQQDAPQPRPVPLKWLAILPVLDAVQSFVGGYQTLSSGSEAAAAAGLSMAYLLTGAVLLGVLGLVTAAGMWIAKRWGWWLAAYYFVYTALRSLSGVASAASAGQGTAGLLQFGLPLLIGLIVVVYLYTPGGRRQFGVSLGRIGPSLLLLISAGAATILLFLGLAAIL